MQHRHLSPSLAGCLARVVTWSSLGLTMAACGAHVPIVPTDAAELARQGDWDAAAQAYRRAYDAAPTPQDREQLKPMLEEATTRAIGQHVDAGHQAFATHDLARAEAEYAKGAAWRADDPRVVAGQAATADVRTRGGQALANTRSRLTQLADHPVTLADRAQWQALIKDLEWLAVWPHDFADGVALWREARSQVASFLMLDAREMLATGKSQEAEARTQKALAWSPGYPEALALMEKLRAGNDVQQRLVQAESDLQTGRLEAALVAYEALAARPSPAIEAVTGLRETRKRLVADLILRAKDQRASKNWPTAMRLASRAKTLVTDDSVLNAEADKVFAETHEKLAVSWAKPMALALKQKRPAAALLYAEMILTVAPHDKDARKVRAKWASKVAQMAATRLEIVVGSPASAPKKRHSRTLNSAQAPTMPGLDAALVTGVRRGLAAAGMEHAGIAVVSGKKANAQAKLLLTVTSAKLERTTAPEARSKNYLDHVEIVDNPAWADAQARQSSALLGLNVATQELRPVQEGLNESDRELYNLQQQLSEIRTKIAEEDKAYYATQPSPCPDATLNCDATRAKLRWRANVEYYEKQVQKQQAHLADLGPKRLKLQAAVDEKQAAYDAAQKVALDTPKRAPKEIWQAYEYQVERQTYAAQAALQARLELAPSNQTHGKQKKAAVATPFTGHSEWQQNAEDFATGVIEIKGQVLEPNHPSALPGDATVVSQVAERLLAPVLPAVIATIGAHGERFVAAAATAKGDMAKLDQIALAWLTAPGLPQSTRGRVRDQLAALTAWLPSPGRLDAGAIAYDKLPPIK